MNHWSFETSASLKFIHFVRAQTATAQALTGSLRKMAKGSWLTFKEFDLPPELSCLLNRFWIEETISE